MKTNAHPLPGYLLGIVMLLIMGFNALDGEISGHLYGKHSEQYTSTGPLIVSIGWLLIGVAVSLTLKLIQILWKRKK